MAEIIVPTSAAHAVYSKGIKDIVPVTIHCRCFTRKKTTTKE